MNELYMKSVIEDRQREVYKLVEQNRSNRYYGDGARNRQGFNWQWKNGLISWFKIVAKRFKSILSIPSKDRVKAQG